MPDWLRPILSRILSPLIIMALAWIAAKTGIVLTEAQAAQITEFMVTLILFGIGHKWIDSKVSPHDTASITATKETKGAP